MGVPGALGGVGTGVGGGELGTDGGDWDLDQEKVCIFLSFLHQGTIFPLAACARVFQYETCHKLCMHP